MAATEARIDVLPRSTAAGTKPLQAIVRAAKERTALLVAAATSVVVSLGALATSYDGFATEALGAYQAWLLFAVNALFTVAMVVLLSAWIQPARKVAYAFVIAIGFQTLITTDLEVQPLAGTQEVGALSSVRIGSVYNPVENLLSSGIEDRIEIAKRREINRLRERYAVASSLPRLRASLDDILATDGPGGRSDRVELLKSVDAVIADTKLRVRDRVRDIAILIYASAGRDVVRDLLREP
jgi:hypothetical protein